MCQIALVLNVEELTGKETLPKKILLRTVFNFESTSKFYKNSFFLILSRQQYPKWSSGRSKTQLHSHIDSPKIPPVTSHVTRHRKVDSPTSWRLNSKEVTHVDTNCHFPSVPYDILYVFNIFSGISERNNDYSDTLDIRGGWMGEVGLVTFFVLEIPDYKSAKVNIHR